MKTLVIFSILLLAFSCKKEGVIVPLDCKVNSNGDTVCYDDQGNEIPATAKYCRYGVLSVSGDDCPPFTMGMSICLPCEPESGNCPNYSSLKVKGLDCRFRVSRQGADCETCTGRKYRWAN